MSKKSDLEHDGKFCPDIWKATLFSLVVLAAGLRVNPAFAVTAAAVEAAKMQARNADVRVCVPSRKKYLNTQQQLPPDIAKECEDGSNHLAQPIPKNVSAQPHIRDGNIVYVYIGDGTTTLSDAGVTDVSITIHGTATTSTQNTTCNLTAEAPLNSSYFLQCDIGSDAFPNAAQGDSIDFEIREIISYHRYALFTKWVSPASSAHLGPIGFWVPVGMFGTNFKSNTDGIALAALPIGLAAGVQMNFNNTNYVGVSAFANWSIVPQKDSMTGMATGSYDFQSATIGGFADLDGYLYAGYGYALDARKGTANPGSLLVIGVGPRLLEFLKGQSK